MHLSSIVAGCLLYVRQFSIFRYFTLSTRHTSVTDRQKTDGRTDRVTIAYRALAYNAPFGKLAKHYTH